MAQQSVQQIYSRIEDYIDQYAREFYGGNRDQGFRHWAFSEIFLEHDLSNDEIMEKTAIDRADDFEIDGFHVEDSDEQKVIHLFQCKHLKPGTTIRANQLEPFYAAPSRLVDPKQIAMVKNEETKTLHDILIKSIPQEYFLHLVWVTSGTLSPQARQYVESKMTSLETLKIDDSEIQVRVDFEALDLRDLVELYQNHLEGENVSEPVVALKVDPERYHEVKGDYNTLECTIPAGQIIKAFDANRYKIFKLNPRGPLGNKTNREIYKSLTDPVFRRIFHLLNNGISAICDSYKWNGSLIEARNFQIINGCQTTLTLWKARPLIQNDPNVLVNLKLSECPQNLHKFIAKATNTQAPLRAEDFISTDTEQIELQKQFDALNPPWFYEIKRGEWTHMIKDIIPKHRYVNPDGSYRRLKSMDVAQTVVGFLGYPGEAKDKIRFFLNNQLDIKYQEVYQYTSAIQLLLPSIIYREINSRVIGDKKNIEYQALGSTDWLDYARFHLLWLLGELIRTADGYHTSFTLPSKERCQGLISSMDKWFAPAYVSVFAALQSSVNEAVENKTYKGHREFFRSPANYSAIKSKLPTALNFARSAGVDPIALLRN